MGYLSWRAQSAVFTRRSLSTAATVNPFSTARPPASSSSAAAGTYHTDSTATGGGGGKAKATAGTTYVHANRGPRERRRVRVFSYSGLEAATSNFSDQALLGRGSHGSVYRAILRPSGRPVAVKRPSRLHPRHHQRGPGSSGRSGAVRPPRLQRGGERDRYPLPDPQPLLRQPGRRQHLRR